MQCRELVEYMQGLTYEEDEIGLDEVLGNDLLLLHETVEICMLKQLGYKIDGGTVIRAYQMPTRRT